MRLVIRIVVVLVVLLVVALGALVVALPRIASSDAVRARIEQAAAEATGEEVRFAELSFGLVPPRLVVAEPRLGPEADVLARAERIDLRLSLLPLLARAVVVDSLVVEGATLRLVRTRDGIELAGRRPAAARKPPQPSAPPDAETSPGGFSLAVASLSLRDSRLVVEDRTVSPPVTWDFQELNAQARGHSLEEPLDIDATARLASGGRFTVRGTAGLDGALDLALALEDVALAPAAAYAGPGMRVAGALSGDLQARGPDAERVSLLADLVVDDADLSVEDLLFQGRLVLKADLAASQAGPSGPLEIDATAARVRYGGFFEKPPGTEATARGRVVSEAGGNLAIRDMHLKIKNFQAEGRLESGARTLLELDARPFALDGWGELVPPLADYAPTGSLSLEKLVLVPAPLSVRGRVGLQGLRVRLDEQEPIGLDGALVGGGDRIDGQDLVARVGSTAVPLQLALTNLARAPRYRVQAEVVDADAGDLLVALGGKRSLLSGPLTARADLAAPLDAPEPLRALAGRTRLELGQGRLQGVSLLRGTVDRLGSLGEAALLAGAQFGGRDLKRFYEDEFESVTGSFTVGNGQARTDDLRLVYREYSVDLRGALGLLDSSLDFTGKLSISEKVDAALTGAQASAAPRVIPLAGVRGTLESPRVELTREAILALAARGVTEERRGKVEQEIDEHLGEGAGRKVMDTFEGLLGRGRRN